MENKELLQAYKVITKIMKEDSLTMDNSFRRVQSYLSNKICDNMIDSNIIKLND
jgi:pyoverdine/dityrosine biosynthesis protein Dit1